jgi:hypothetical protein
VGKVEEMQQEMQTPWMTIVGKVADVKEDSPDSPSNEQYYSVGVLVLETN